MTDSEFTRDPDRLNDDEGSQRGEVLPPPTPRWVIAFGILAIVLILVFVVSHLAGGGFRGH